MAALLLIVVSLFILFIMFYLYQSQNLHGPFINFLIAVAILLMVISLGLVYVSSSANLTTFNGVMSYIKAYFSWVSSIISSGSNVVGYVVNQDWGVNSSISG